MCVCVCVLQPDSQFPCTFIVCNYSLRLLVSAKQSLMPMTQCTQCSPRIFFMVSGIKVYGHWTRHAYKLQFSSLKTRGGDISVSQNFLGTRQEQKYHGYHSVRQLPQILPLQSPQTFWHPAQGGMETSQQLGEGLMTERYLCVFAKVECSGKEHVQYWLMLV